MNENNEEYNKKNKEMFIKLSGLKKSSEEYIKLRNEILLFNQGLIYKTLELEKDHYSLDNCEYNDIVQTCNIFLLKAIEKYDHTLGTNFSTYSWYWIMRGIRDCMDRNQIVYLPEHMIRKYWKEDNEELKNLLKQRSLEDIYRDEDILYDKDPRDLFCYGIRGTDNNVSIFYEDIEFKDLLEKMQKNLKPREKHILYLYYDKEYTLEMIGKEYSLTRERVRQIILQALRKCMFSARKLRLKMFL